MRFTLTYFPPCFSTITNSAWLPPIVYLSLGDFPDKSWISKVQCSSFCSSSFVLCRSIVPKLAKIKFVFFCFVLNRFSDVLKTDQCMFFVHYIQAISYSIKLTEIDSPVSVMDKEVTDAGNYWHVDTNGQTNGWKMITWIQRDEDRMLWMHRLADGCVEIWTDR